MTRLPFLLFALAAVVAAGDAPKPIFDGRLTLAPGKLSAAEQKLFHQAVAPAARKAWRERERDTLCEPGFPPAAIDIAAGAFTRAGAAQKAILYRYCAIGHNLLLDGVAVIEGDRVAAHILFEGGENTAIGALADLNGNGVSELLIAAGATDQGVTSAWMSIVELAPGGHVTKFGQTATLSDDCGAKETGCVATAWRIWAKAGARPAFFKDAFVTPGAGARAWRKTGALSPIQLDEDAVEYEALP